MSAELRGAPITYDAMNELIAYCADIGSIPGRRFGWARLPAAAPMEARLGTSISDLVERIAVDIDAGRPVALGFECPLFIPARDDPASLTRARQGEGKWPWSAGAGAQVLVTGLPQVLWILARLRESAPEAKAYVNWQEFETAGEGLFIWEAFVSGKSKFQSDAPADPEDARIAARDFLDVMPDPTAYNAIEEESVHSLIGAGLLRTGWSDDLRLLQAPCLVIRSRGSSEDNPGQRESRREHAD